MTIVLDKDDHESLSYPGSVAYIRLTVEQARRLRDQITRHLRKANRDKEEPTT
jgi:hypothetical protein